MSISRMHCLGNPCRCSSRVIAVLSVVAALQLRPTHAAAAQQQTSLNTFARCAECRLLPIVDSRIGANASRPIDQDAWLAFNHETREYVLVATASHLRFFDRDGRFKREVDLSVAGKEPIIRAIDFAGQNTLVMDVGSFEWVTISPTGVILRRRSGPVGDGFLSIGADTVVLGVMSRTPDAVGYPLHLVTISDGAETRHFGSERGEFNAGRAWADRVLLARDLDRSTVLVANPSRLQIEGWSPSGARSTIVEGNFEWFPGVEQLPALGHEPATRLREFAMDSAGRLWILTRVASKNWQQAYDRARRTSDGEVLLDQRVLFDTRIDVFDLRRRLYYGSYRSESDRLRLLDRAGDVLLQLPQKDTAGRDVIALYRLQVHTQSGTPR